MCFSATASFAASAILAGAGAVSLSASKSVKEKYFAAIPLIFSAQQFVEGVLWLSLRNTAYAHWEMPATFSFLAIAQVVWPFWVPFSVLMFEENKSRKNWLKFLTVFGFLVASYLAYSLFTYPAKADISGYHVNYTLETPLYSKWYSGFFYFIPTVVPPFMSGAKYMRSLGIIILASFVLAKLFFPDYLISVWCYFAAVLSAVVFIVVKARSKEGREESRN
jgi:hypothetical protein